MRRAAATALAAGLAGGLLACGGGDGGDATPARLPDLVPGRGTVTALVKVDKALWSRPGGGRRLARMARRTRFRSPRVVPVVGRRGSWLAVLAPELRNGRVGWVDGRRAVTLHRTEWSMEVRLSRRLLVVRNAGRVVERVRVAIGRPGTPTPTGRFAVTDRLTTGRDTGPYGCCVLALSAHQPNVPQGWGGGDQVAIHATAAQDTIGRAVSLGCLRTTNATMRRLVRDVPLGTVVRIRP